MLSLVVLRTTSQCHHNTYIIKLLSFVHCSTVCPKRIKLLYCYRIVCSEDELHGRRLDAIQLYDHREWQTAGSGRSTGLQRWLQPTGV